MILNVEKGLAGTWGSENRLVQLQSNYFLISWFLITISMSLVRIGSLLRHHILVSLIYRMVMCNSRLHVKILLTYMMSSFFSHVFYLTREHLTDE